MPGLVRRKGIAAKGLWMGAALAALLAAALTFDPKLYINGDNVDYILMARRILAGEIWPAGRFPPLFPALLAGIQGLFGESLIPQKLLVLCFYAGSVWMLGRLVARRADPSTGPLLLVAAATLIPIVEFAHYIMTEIPYLFFLLGALDAADRLLVDRDLRLLGDGALAPSGRGAAMKCHSAERHSVRNEVQHKSADISGKAPCSSSSLTAMELALWIAAAFYVRSAGITIAVGILICLFAAGRWRHAAVSASCLLLLLIPWVVRSATQPGGSPYLQQILLVNPLYPEFGTITPGFLWSRLRDNTLFYMREQIPCLLLPAMYRSTYSRPEIRDAVYPVWIALPLLVPLMLGIARGLRRLDPMAWVAGSGIGLTLLWPWIWRGSRFLVPILPLLFIFWLSGWGPSKNKGAGSRWRGIRIGLLTLIIILGVRNLVVYAKETLRHPPEWEHYFTALEWIRDNTPVDAVIIDRKPGFSELIARREASNFPREEDPARMLEFFVERGADYVVLPSLPFDDIARYLVPAIGQSRPYFEVVFGLPMPEVYVLQFFPQGGRGEPGVISPEDAEEPIRDPGT